MDIAPVPHDAAYLVLLEERIAMAEKLLAVQRSRVAEAQAKGYVPNLTSVLLKNFQESLALLHWQRAVILSTTRDKRTIATSQPSPSWRPPAKVLELINAELQTMNDGSAHVTNEQFREATERVVHRALFG